MSMMKNEKTGIVLTTVKILFLLGTLYFGITGVYLNITNTPTAWRSLGFYTIQSNLICIFACVFYIWHLFSKKKLDESLLALIQGGVVMCIMLTFLVYHFLLSPAQSFDINTLEKSNAYVHYYLPLMILAYYLLFCKKGLMRYKTMWIWTLVPIAYCIFVFIYSAFGGRFGADGQVVPYFFLDYIKFGISGVAKWILLLTVGYLSLSAIFVCIDKFSAFVYGKIGKRS